MIRVALNPGRLKWEGNTLSGRSRLVANDIYEIYIYEPEGFTFTGYTVEGAKIKGDRKKIDIRIVSLFSEAGGRVKWEVKYAY